MPPAIYSCNRASISIKAPWTPSIRAPWILMPIWKKKTAQALNLKNYKITGKIWHLLRENSRRVKVRVLHALIAKNKEIDILRGLPEGIRLSPTLFWTVFLANFIWKCASIFLPCVVKKNPRFARIFFWLTRHFFWPTRGAVRSTLRCLPRNFGYVLLVARRRAYFRVFVMVF